MVLFISDCTSHSEDEKRAVLDYITHSSDEAWIDTMFTQENLQEPCSLCNRSCHDISDRFDKYAEVFGAFLQRISKLSETNCEETIDVNMVFKCIYRKYENENETILHKLSKDPLSEAQLMSIMDALRLGVQPNIGVGKQTFLQTSPIATKLIVHIRASQDSWAKELWNEKSIESWIHLSDDDVLVSILKRFCTLFFRSEDNRKNEFDPLKLARCLWTKKSQLPSSIKVSYF